MANGPSIKPDWSTATTQSLNLSGQQITFSLPGNISTDIPARISDNLNIYDPDIYNEWKNQEIAKVWWDYKKKVLLLFPELLGTLELRIVIHDRSMEAGTDLFHPAQLEATIAAIYKRGFPEPEDSNRLPDDYKSVDINGKAWLKYLNRGGKTSEDRLCYAIPITATHFLEVSFRVIKTDESDTDNWYEVSQSDMEKMINSFSVNYTESSQPK